MTGWRRHVRQTDDGYAYWVDAPPVPRLHDLFLNSSVYIYPTQDQAREGRGGEGGSGFITTIWPDHPQLHGPHSYIVTAKHVVSGRPEIWIRVNRRVGKPVYIHVEPHEWDPHPSADIAVVKVGNLNPFEMQIAHVPQPLYVTREVMSWPNADDYDPEKLGIGDECYFFGRFMSHPGTERNLPMLRFGNLAMMPGEPVGGEEAFLVEFKSMPGFSGSPVFIYRTGRIDHENNYVPAAKSQIAFLGIDFCHLPEIVEFGKRDEAGEFKKVGDGTLLVKHSAGIMGVVPAWKLRELLMSPKQEARRRELEEEALELVKRRELNDSLEPTLEGVGEVKPLPDEDDEYRRFEDVARKLVQVPKDEIDEARKREDERA
jgi:hypothetical protein